MDSSGGYLAKQLEIYYNMAYAEHITETKLVNLLIEIKAKCENILKFAFKYDYDSNHQFNGYRSTVLFVIKFLEAVHCTKLNENFDGTVDEVECICNALNNTLNSVLQFHENSLKYHKNSERINSNSCDDKKTTTEKEEIFKLQVPIDKQSLVNALEAMQNSDIPFIFNKYYEFYYKTTNLNDINQTLLSSFTENFDVWSWFKTLTSLSHSTFNSTSLFLNATQLGLTSSSQSNLNLIKTWLPFLSSSKPYIVETITIKRQLEWLICPITYELKHNPMKFQVLNNRKKYIKCKLLRNTVNSSGHLLIYLFSPDYFQKENDISSSFLSDWSKLLPGCSILIPELIYDKNEKFITPMQLQDCLDCYLWTIGRNNSVNKFKLLNMPRQFTNGKNSSNENLSSSLKQTTNHHSHHTRSSSIGGLSSYFPNVNSLSSNSSINSNSTAQNSNPIFKNSEQVLGTPEHIVLCGDSSGGNLATTLLLVLNDLKTKFKLTDLRLPNALVTAFTPFNLRDCSPIMQLTSRFSYSLSPIIALTACESHLPLPEIEEIDHNNLISINESSRKENLIVENDDLKLPDPILNGEIKDKPSINGRIKRQQRSQQKKRTTSLNKYLIDQLNEYKLSDFFQQFNYSTNNSNDGKQPQQNDDDHQLPIDDDREINITTNDASKIIGNESVTQNDELNNYLSYFANTLMSYLSQYYNTHISAQINHLGSISHLEEEIDGGGGGDDDGEETYKSIKNTNQDEQRKMSEYLKSNFKKINLVDNQENQDSLIQNAFSIFRLLFFNSNQSGYGGEKEANETLRWKDVVDKIFTEQREQAFLDLTRRPYISPAFYDDFESLKNVSIYLLSSTCDMFLDDNICMAKKWTGHVTLEVLQDQLPRGFLIERFLVDAKEGQLVFFKMVKEALELTKKLPKIINQQN